MDCANILVVFYVQRTFALRIIGLVLGPVAEIRLRRALMLSGFDWGSVLMRPIAGTLLSLIYGFYGQFRRQWCRKRAALEAA